MQPNTKEFISGVKKTIPLMIGITPFGLACGIVASQAGLKLAESGFMSIVVFAGASQFVAISMIKQGVGFAFIILSTLLINLRHLLMGLSLAPYLKKQKPSFLSVLAFFMVDESYAVTISHYQKPGTAQGNPFYMLGSSLGLYVTWIVSTVIGGLLGQSIKDPLSWGVDFAMPAMFLSILIPQIKSWRTFVVVLVSGTVAIAANVMIPGKWYIIIAAITATLVGTVMENRAESRCALCEMSTYS